MMRSFRVDDTRSDAKEKVETLGVSDPTRAGQSRPSRTAARKDGVDQLSSSIGPDSNDTGSADSSGVENG
jgi:hypothetical protein